MRGDDRSRDVGTSPEDAHQPDPVRMSKPDAIDCPACDDPPFAPDSPAFDHRRSILNDVLLVPWS